MKRALIIWFGAFVLLLCSNAYAYVTGTPVISWTVVSTNNTSVQRAIIDGWLLERAHAFGYENNITSIASLNRFLPDNFVNREQSAKMMVQFARFALGDDYFYRVDKRYDCNFPDKDTISKDLRTYVIESCRFGIFKWYGSGFAPKSNLTTYQAYTVLGRILQKELPTNDHKPITRGELIVKMYKLLNP